MIELTLLHSLIVENARYKPFISRVNAEMDNVPILQEKGQEMAKIDDSCPIESKVDEIKAMLNDFSIQNADDIQKMSYLVKK